MAIQAAPEPGARSARTSAQQELSLLCSSVGMVAAGGARRVTHVGLRHAERILPSAQAEGRRLGIVVRAIWRGRAGCDITVEPIG
jgi:hypothetical protein